MSAPDRTKETFPVGWRGIPFWVTYAPNWLGLADHVGQSAHLEIRSLGRRPLPVSETGYFSHYADPGDVAQAGGPVAYALAMLDAAAHSRRWRGRPQQPVQLTLF